MNKEDILAVLLAIVVVLTATVLIYGASYVMPERQCEAKAAGIGVPWKYGWIGGCQIEVEENLWIPLEAYYWKDEK